MQNEGKTRTELLEEIDLLRNRVAQLKQVESAATNQTGYSADHVFQAIFNKSYKM